MSEAAVSFQIFGRSCVVILPPSLDVPPANDVQAPAPGVAQRAQAAQFCKVAEPAVLSESEQATLAVGQSAPVVPAPRPSEIVLRSPGRE